MKGSLIAALAATACSGSNHKTVDAMGIDRGPTNVALDADPNGAWWDAATNTLYLADQQGNQIISWTDASGFGAMTALPAAPSGDTELGGLAETSANVLLTPRFGFGTAGGMIEVPAAGGSATMVANLDDTRRRLGVAIAADGTILDTYFVKTTTTVGAVAVLDTTAGTETDLITGLTKPVGVAVIGTTVYVGDQPNNVILTADLAGAPGTGSAFATPTGPDLMTVGPNSTLFTGSTVGDVYQIDSTGTVSTFQSGFNETRGVAYDAVNKRLFVAEHVATGTTHALHIFPVDE